jgi:hypothetical protein
MFIDVHTWGGYYGYSIEYTLGRFEQLFNRVYARMIANTGVSPQIGNWDLLASSAFCWAQQQMSALGVATASCVFEPGSFETNIEQARLGMNFLLLSALEMCEGL